LGDNHKKGEKMKKQKFDQRTKSLRIPIEDILDNPFRDFNIFPIEKSVVESLKASYSTSGDFGVIPVRRHPEERYAKKGKYQQLCGHHRMQALREIGIKIVDCKVIQGCTDDMALTIMTGENLSGSHRAVGAIQDSLMSLAKVIGYRLLRYSDYDRYKKDFASTHGVCKKKDSWETARGKFKKGNGIGATSISNFVGKGQFTATEIADTNRIFKETGIYDKILDHIISKFEKEKSENLIFLNSNISDEERIELAIDNNDLTNGISDAELAKGYSENRIDTNALYMFKEPFQHKAFVDVLVDHYNSDQKYQVAKNQQTALVEMMVDYVKNFEGGKNTKTILKRMSAPEIRSYAKFCINRELKPFNDEDKDKKHNVFDVEILIDRLNRSTKSMITAANNLAEAGFFDRKAIEIYAVNNPAIKRAGCFLTAYSEYLETGKTEELKKWKEQYQEKEVTIPGECNLIEMPQKVLEGIKAVNE
jgi:hypothetical protein